MDKYIKIKRNKLETITIDTIFEYIFALSIIFCGGTMYGVLEYAQKMGITSYTFRVLAMFAAMLLICVYLITKKDMISKSQIMRMLLMIAVLAIYLGITRFKIKPALEGMCIPLILFVVLCILDDANELFTKFFDAYDNIATLIGAVSVIFYLLGPATDILAGTDILYYNYDHLNSGKSYYYLFFVNNDQIQNLMGHEIIRNVGIFMEAPSFANMLIFALFWELFQKEGKRKLRVTLLLITLLTTFSTKAFLFGSMLIAAYILFVYGEKNTIIKSLRSLIIPLAGACGAVLVLIVLIKKSDTAGSMSIRMDDTYSAFVTWLQHPLFGAGFYNMEEIYNNYKWTTMKGDPTAGLINILAFGGIFMFTGFLVCLWGIWNKIKLTNKTTNRVFVVMLIGMLLISAMQYSYITLFILAVGLEVTIGNRYETSKHKKELCI